VQKLEAAKAGDQAAFRALAEQAWPKLYRVLLRLVEDPGAAEDLGQEALLRAWQQLPEFRGEATFDTWVVSIGVNLARNHRKRRRPLLLSDPDRDQVDPGPTPDAIAEDRERWTELTAAFQRLPPNWRAALQCVLVENMSYEQAALALHTRPASIRNWVHRGRVRLRQQLGSDGPTERVALAPMAVRLLGEGGAYAHPSL
jgi:RNA polymerase sigma-70 factor (ECF subfamily)